MPNSRCILVVTLSVLCALAAVVPALAGGRGFRTQHMLEEHYARYGQAFGKVSQEQYLRMAQQLRDARPGKNVLEAKMAGGGAKFDKRYGWFVSFDNDGTLRTFFIPKEGIRYFARQGGNRPPPE